MLLNLVAGARSCGYLRVRYWAPTGSGLYHRL